LKIINKKKRRVLLLREQYYLDNINPSLNVCRKANSPLGVKRDITFSINPSKAKIGKNLKSRALLSLLESKQAMFYTRPKVVTSETITLISKRCEGVNVKVFDKANNLVNQFPTITSAALHFGLGTKTIRMVYKTGKSYDAYTYKFEVKDNRV